MPTGRPAAGTKLAALAAGRSGGDGTVLTSTLDFYAAQAGIPGFALVKVDTEGHDLTVLRGARPARGAAHCRRPVRVQPPLGVRPRVPGDAFDLLSGSGYQVGKLTPKGVEFYPGWDAELEAFVEGNYVACASLVAEGMPTVRWSKSGQ